MYSVNDKSMLLLCYNGYSRYTVMKYKINSRYQKLFQRTFLHDIRTKHSYKQFILDIRTKLTAISLFLNPDKFFHGRCSGHFFWW